MSVPSPADDPMTDSPAPTAGPIPDAPATFRPLRTKRGRALHDLRAEIKDCRRCVVAGFLPEAHPIAWGWTGQRAMLVGQAPAARGHLAVIPWSGGGGVKLRAWLRDAGFEGEDALQRTFLVSAITRCFPGPSPSGKGDRAPSPSEIAICADHLDGELALVRPELIVSLGLIAARRVGAKGALGDLVGTRLVGERAGVRYTLIPLPHPSGVSHFLNSEEGRGKLADGLRLLGEERAARGL